MTKKAETWMPLLVAKYLADTMHLSTEQHGAYLLLLMHAWMNGGALPVEDDKLRRITRMSPKAWGQQGADIRAFFTESEGALRQKRIDLELARAHGNIEQRVAAGKASAERRAAQRKAEQDGNETPNETPNETATTVERTEQRNRQRNGRPIPTPSSSLRSEEGGEARKRATPPKPPDVTQQTWDDFLSLRRAKRAPVTQTVIEGAVCEAAKAGLTLEAFLGIWCRRGSQGLEAAWLKPQEVAGARQSATDRQTATMNALTGRDRDHDRRTAPVAEVVDIAARVVR